MNGVFVILALLGRVTGQSDISISRGDWDFENLCLGMRYPTAYVDGKNGQLSQCVIALEDDGAVATQIKNRCGTIKNKKGIPAVPYDSTSITVDQLEKYFALKQTGVYYAANGEVVVTSSGKKTDVQGYLCSLSDTYKCEVGWDRYRNYCYLAVNVSVSFDDALNACADKQGTLPRIINDEENKFVAMLGRSKIFKDALGKNEIWGPLSYSVPDNLWQYGDIDTPDRKVLYMRWWSTDKGIYPVVNKPKVSYTASTIFTGRNNQDLIAYFGYWGTAKPTDKKPFICRRQIEKI